MLRIKSDPQARHERLKHHLWRHNWLYFIQKTDGTYEINHEMLAQVVEEWEGQS